MYRHILQSILSRALPLLESRSLLLPEQITWLEDAFSECSVVSCPTGVPSACILPPPVPEGDSLRFPPLRIQLEAVANAETQLYIACHEMAHFLSVDAPRSTGQGEYTRRWGICRTVYRVQDGQVHALISDEAMRLANEHLTDCLACWLYTEAEGHPPAYRFQQKRGEWADCEQELLLKQFLQHQYPASVRHTHTG